MSKDEDFEEFIRRWILPAMFGYPTLNSFLYMVKDTDGVSVPFQVGTIATGIDRFIVTVKYVEENR